MIYLNAALSQHFGPTELPAAVRTALGKPLRRTTALTQLALTGALACLPKDRRSMPTALLWQSTRGLREETRQLLNAVCDAVAEPMPYDFLASQPALAAVQIQPYLPGLQTATHFPLDRAEHTQWALLISLASHWLKAGRHAQVLCAHLDVHEGVCSGHWLSLSAQPLENSPASIHLNLTTEASVCPDTPEFPHRLTSWLNTAAVPGLHLQSPAAPRLAVEFVRI